jgi:hypothetical protein
MSTATEMPNEPDNKHPLGCSPVGLITIWLLLVAGFFYLKSGFDAPIRSANNASSWAMLDQLVRAIEVYRTKYGAYPPMKPGASNGDADHYLKCLVDAKIIQYPGYDNSFLSAFDKPYLYIYPVTNCPASDGIIHNNITYYLWTWGYDRQEHASDWAINNWDKR